VAANGVAGVLGNAHLRLGAPVAHLLGQIVDLLQQLSFAAQHRRFL